MNYAKAIRIARSIADLSQGQLADKADVDRSYLSLIESGKRVPSVETIGKISTALSLPFHLLTLLGSEESDTKGVSHQQIIGLSEALARLAFHVSDDKEKQSSGSKRKQSKAVPKPARSRTSAERESANPTRSRRKLVR